MFEGHWGLGRRQLVADGAGELLSSIGNFERGLTPRAPANFRRSRFRERRWRLAAALAVGTLPAAAAAAAELNSDDAGDDAPAPEQSDAPLPKATVKARADLLPEEARASRRRRGTSASSFCRPRGRQRGRAGGHQEAHDAHRRRWSSPERHAEARAAAERKAPKAKAKPAAAAEASEPAAAAAGHRRRRRRRGAQAVEGGAEGGGAQAPARAGGEGVVVRGASRSSRRSSMRARRCLGRVDMTSVCILGSMISRLTPPTPLRGRPSDSSR